MAQNKVNTIFSRKAFKKLLCPAPLTEINYPHIYYSDNKFPSRKLPDMNRYSQKHRPMSHPAEKEKYTTKSYDHDFSIRDI